MARNGSGTFSPSVTFVTEAASPPIAISKLDTAIDDIGDEITNSIAADGQTQPSADLPMNGHKHTNVGAATALTHYARVSELIDQDHVYYVDSGSANTYVITPSPAITAYEEGQRFVFRAANANSGASTLNVNAQGAVAIQTPDGSALATGAIIAGGYYEVVYDANPATDRWVLMSPPSEIPTSMLPSSVWTSANDGTGSGLDADTLDGSEGSAFAKLSGANPFDSGSTGLVASFNSTAASGPYVSWKSSSTDIGYIGDGGEMGSGFTTGAFAIDSPSGKALQFGTSNTMRAEITSDGTFKYGSDEVGFRNAVRVTDALSAGKVFATSSGFTLSTGLAAGTTYGVYNNSGSAITITQGSGVTLRQNGTSETGNVSLAARGLATIWCNSTTEYVISGPVS